MAHYRVWLACDNGPHEVDPVDWTEWQSLSALEQVRREQLSAQASGVFYAGMWEAQSESDALQQALDWVRDNDIDVVCGS